MQLDVNTDNHRASGCQHRGNRRSFRLTGRTHGAPAYRIRVSTFGYYTPNTEAVSTICTSVQRDYLAKFDDGELYWSFSNLQDMTTSSQGAESQLAAAVQNNIRSVEPQKMLTTVLLTQRSNFLMRQAAALSCTQPVPPYAEKYLAQLITSARPYQPSVTFLPGT